jgi:hypothetical protein
LTDKDLINKSVSAFQSKQGYEDEDDERKIKMVLNRLISERYISRVKIINNGIFLNLNLEITNPIKLSKSKVQTTAKITKALPTKNTKKRKIDEIQQDDEMEIEGEPSKKFKLMEEETEDMSEKLWMINVDQFIRKFRHEEIINLVLKRINPTCAIIIAKIIELVSGAEKSKNDQVSRKNFFAIKHEKKQLLFNKFMIK